MHILLLHPVSDWSLDRVAAICDREDWRLTIVTIEESTVADHVTTLHEWIRVPALSDSPQELLAQIGSRRFDAVAAGNEFAVIAADVLAGELGLYHNDVARIRASRNKALMREMFAEYDVPQPRTIGRLSSVSGNREFDWQGVAFPVIVKPVDMAMSLFVRKCDSRDEVEATLAKMSVFKTSRLTNYAFSEDALVEEYVPGPEFSLECVVQDGKAVVHALTQKFSSPLPACYEIGHISGGDIPPEHQRELLAATERIASGWGMAQGVMHVEFKMTPERISIIEAAARPAGGHVPELVELQHGLSLEDAYLRARAGLDWKPDPGEPLGSWYGIRFHFDERSPVTRPDSVAVVRVHDDAGGVVAGAEPFSVNRRTGFTLLRSESLKDLDGYIRAT
ncbi:ATP-grasp domain-containing protein [Streptomyces sp. SID10853]|uniref:ATP-grasp domain-containing protein n=1 Tax=Streptomyces sp. SID10853 TaxID=2706028 RepID=UPI0013C1D203|nr:ATP-grasp domain-containing protein [Streptomyces sp. SID10853]NDZ81374.1 ATP-grasp domain-containing protein [Streptomyces sp. SID10853]